MDIYRSGGIDVLGLHLILLSFGLVSLSIRDGNRFWYDMVDLLELAMDTLGNIMRVEPIDFDGYEGSMDGFLLDNWSNTFYDSCSFRFLHLNSLKFPLSSTIPAFLKPRIVTFCQHIHPQQHQMSTKEMTANKSPIL